MQSAQTFYRSLRPDRQLSKIQQGETNTKQRKGIADKSMQKASNILYLRSLDITIQHVPDFEDFVIYLVKQ